MLVAADDVFDQIPNGPLRAGRRGAQLVGIEVGKDAGERVLSALVSN
jgi:hypothetical protein